MDLNRHRVGLRRSGRFWLVSALVLSAGLTFCAATFVVPLPERYIAFEFFRRQANSIDPPPETTFVEATEYTKGDIARLSVRYQSNYRTSSMLQYYAERLPSLGWSQTLSNNNDSTILSQYCQDPYALRIRSANAYYTLEYSRGIDSDCAGGKLGVGSSLLILAWSLPMSIVTLLGAFSAIRHSETFAMFGRNKPIPSRLLMIVTCLAIGLLSSIVAFVGIRSLLGH
jgi:hypothetical protein